jgi:hypothetical protein
MTVEPGMTDDGAAISAGHSYISPGCSYISPGCSYRLTGTSYRPPVWSYLPGYGALGCGMWPSLVCGKTGTDSATVGNRVGRVGYCQEDVARPRAGKVLTRDDRAISARECPSPSHETGVLDDTRVMRHDTAVRDAPAARTGYRMRRLAAESVWAPCLSSTPHYALLRLGKWTVAMAYAIMDVVGSFLRCHAPSLASCIINGNSNGGWIKGNDQSPFNGAPSLMHMQGWSYGKGGGGPPARKLMHSSMSARHGLSLNMYNGRSLQYNGRAKCTKMQNKCKTFFSIFSSFPGKGVH